jgi:hypothetical protein
MKLAEIKEAKEEPGIKVWDSEKNRNTVIPFRDKQKVVKFILGVLKNYHGEEATENMIRIWINGARHHGYDYPEFKMIEKSTTQ